MTYLMPWIELTTDLEQSKYQVRASYILIKNVTNRNASLELRMAYKHIWSQRQ